MPDKKQISKLISYWLRHEPQNGNLVPDEYGWVAVDALLESLKKRKMDITVPELVELSKSFDKVRWQFSDDLSLIRATHGHSIPVVLKDATIPPAILYHGTAGENLAAIARLGLITMNRQFVHLSADTEMALSVGKRHGKAALIEVNTQPLINGGWLFYNTSERVWLTSGIPAQYLKFPQS